VTKQEFILEEHETLIRAILPAWRSRFVDAILNRKRWTILLAGAICLFVAAMALGFATIGIATIGIAHTAQADPFTKWRITGNGLFFILLSLAIIAAALYDLLWEAKGYEMIQFTSSSIRTSNYIMLRDRILPASWPKSYSLDRISDLFVSSGAGWYGRVRFYYRIGLGKRLVKLAGGIGKTEAELMMTKVENRFPAYVQIKRDV